MSETFRVNVSYSDLLVVFELFKMTQMSCNYPLFEKKKERKKKQLSPLFE
jgi:hypothetical protein